MSFENTDIKEKTSVLILDSDSSFDTKSLAKSININELENENQEESARKELEKCKIFEEQNEKSNLNSSNFIAQSKSYGENKNLDDFDSNLKKIENKIESEIEHIISNFEKIVEINKIYPNSNLNKDIINEINTVEANANVYDNLLNKITNQNNFNNNSKINNMSDISNTNDNNYTKISHPNLDKNFITPQASIETNNFLTSEPNLTSDNNKILLEKLDNLDKSLSQIIHDLNLGRNMDMLIYIFARLFNPDFIVSYFLVILSYKIYINNDYLFVIKPIISTVVCLGVTLSLKKYFGRKRPNYSKISKRIYDLRKLERNCSMPSGDSLQAANFSIILFFYFDSTLGFYIIPFVMFARIYFYCHFLFDTVVGVTLGIFWSSLVYYCVNCF